MRVVFPFLLMTFLPLTSVSAEAEHQPDGRYVLLERELPTKEKLILKFDSETGKTWRLSERDGQQIWTPIPDAQTGSPKEKANLDKGITVYPN